MSQDYLILPISSFLAKKCLKNFNREKTPLNYSVKQC